MTCPAECQCADCKSLAKYMRDMVRASRRPNPCRYRDCGRQDCDYCNQRAEWER